MKSLSLAFASTCAVACLSSFAATTYYWTGAADVGQAKCEFFTAGNWAKADGTVATAAPVKGDTVVFTNDTALTLSANANLPSYCWRFEGPGDVLGPGQTEGSQKSYSMSSGASAVANGGGTYKLDYSVSLGTNMGDFIVDVAEGSTMGLSTYGTTTMYSGSRLVKRGAGTERHDRLFPNAGSVIRLEEGYLSLNRGGNTNNTGATVVFEIAGPAAKKLGCDEGTLVIPHYVETEDALGTLSFVISNGNHRSILMKGTATVTRCSADIYNEREGLTHQLVWNPDGATTLDLVGRIHDQASGKLYAKSGKMRFAEDAGIRRLNELRVGAGAEVEITRSANDTFREMTLAVEEGGVLRIDGVSEVATYNQNAVASDFYPTNSIVWDGLIDLCGKRRLYLNRSWNATGSRFSCGAAAGLRLSGTDVHRILTYSVGDITLSNYVETAEAEMTGDFACYTSSDDHLILRGAEDMRFTSDIYNLAGGLYQLVWDPVDATKTLTVAKRTFAKSHPGFRVKQGRMRFAEGAAISSATVVEVDAGAVLSFAGDAGVAFQKTTLALADATATVEVDVGKVIFVKEVKVGGTAVGTGVYASGDTAWVTGGGALVVVAGDDAETTYATWMGGGATAALNDAANWGGTLPDLTKGSLVATFPVGIKSVIVPATGAFMIRGIVAEDPEFRLTGAETSLLLLGKEGITLPDRAETSVVEVTCPICLTQAQVWSIGTNNVLRLTETARLSGGVAGTVVTQKGLEGVVEYRSSGDGLFGSFEIAEGTAKVYADNAFGGSTCTLKQSNRALIDLHGCTLDCAILLGGSSVSVLRSSEGVNVLNGQVRVDDPNVATFDCLSASELHFCGGVSYTGINNGASWSPLLGFRLWVEETPVSIQKMMLGTDDSAAGSLTTELHLDVADNGFPRGLIMRYDKTRANVLSTGVPYALKLDGGGVSFAEDATKSSWDLCGCDQHANVFFSRCVGAKVTSEAPATLHLVDDALNYVKPTERDNNNMKWSIQGTASQVDRTTFAGAASFSKDGALTHYLMGESTSTGGVYVTKGELVFTKASATPVTLSQTTAITGPEKDGYAYTPLTGSWRTATEAVVTGGKLKLEHGQVFSKATDVKVSGSGVIELAAGVVQKCHTLTIGETVYEAGTWGGPKSNAEHKDAHFAGSGMIRVVGAGLGLRVIVR